MSDNEQCTFLKLIFNYNIFIVPFACIRWMKTFGDSILCKFIQSIEFFLFGYDSLISSRFLETTSTTSPIRRANNHNLYYQTLRHAQRLRYEDGSNPLLDVINKFPRETAWFFRISLLLGTICGVALGCSMLAYLYLNWEVCSGCSRPLRAWFLIMALLQLAQSPLRYCYYKRVKSASRSVMETILITTDNTTNRITETNNGGDEEDESITSEELTEITLPNPNFIRGAESSMNGNLNHSLLYHHHHHHSPYDDTMTIGNTNRSASLEHLCIILASITSSGGWCLTMWLSVIIYAWFLVGGIWAFSEEVGCAPFHNHTNEDDAFWNTSSFETVEVVVLTDVPSFSMQAAIILIIGLTLVRLLIMMFLFYIAVPSCVLPRNHINHRDDLDYHYQWTETSLTSTDQGSTYDEDQEFGFAYDISGFAVLQNFIHSMRRQNQATTTITSPTRHSKGLSIALLEKLPVSYFSQYVFPYTLKSPRSLIRVKTECEKQYEKFGIHQTKQQSELSPFIQYLEPSSSEYQKTEFPTLSSVFLLQHKGKISPSSVRCRLKQCISNFNNKKTCRETQCRISPNNTETCTVEKDQMSATLQSTTSSPTKTGYNTIISKILENELSYTPPLYLPTCSICFEDFEEGSAIRHLPCRHGFHRRCIDRWLIQKDSCPLCQSHCRLGRTSNPEVVPVVFASNQ